MTKARTVIFVNIALIVVWGLWSKANAVGESLIGSHTHLWVEASPLYRVLMAPVILANLPSFLLSAVIADKVVFPVTGLQAAYWFWVAAWSVLAVFQWQGYYALAKLLRRSRHERFGG